MADATNEILSNSNEIAYYGWMYVMYVMSVMYVMYVMYVISYFS